MAEEKYKSFLRRHSDPYMPTLNPQSVMARLYDLESQIDDLEKIFESEEFDRHYKFNLLNYYVVASVTCLEWHARGRLVDFISVYPDKIEQSDFSNLKNSALNFARNTETIAQLIGAIKNVSSADDYIALFKRVFEGIGSKADPWKLVSSFSVIDGVNLIERLFEERHALVHEIWVNQIGPYELRDGFDFQEARSTVKMVEKIVEAIEAEIATYAPRSFPNAGDDWDEVEILENLIIELENEIESKLKTLNGGSEVWSEIKENRMRSWDIERKALLEFDELRPVRWLDYRSSVKIKILRSRYSILKYIKQKINELYE